MKYCSCHVANPYPAVHKGGMSAVAMATPGITLPFCRHAAATIPAPPPKKPISTSYIVGDVRASSSDRPSLTGEIRKKSVDAITENSAATARLRAERLISAKS